MKYEFYTLYNKLSMSLIPTDDSKVNLHEVLCFCGDFKCTKFNCKVPKSRIEECTLVNKNITYADVLKKVTCPSEEWIENRVKKAKLLNLKYDSVDNQLNCFQTLIGHTYDRELYEIVSELENNFFGEISSKPLNDKILDLKGHVLERNNKSKIGNFADDNLIVNTSIRNSLSLTFGSETVEKLSTILKPKIIESINYTSEVIEEVRFHPNHGDILLYQTGGKFDVHRDKELEFPFEDEQKDTDEFIWEMYSMVFCLDSNLMDRFASDEGNTVVYLPPWASQNGTKVDEKEFDLVRLAPHVFNQVVIQGSYVAFPSLAKHSSVEILTPGKEKFALKMDFWVKTKKKIGDYYSYDRFFSYDSHNPINNNNISQNIYFRCNCKLCDTVGHRFQPYMIKMLSKKLCDDLARFTMQYIDIFNYVDHQFDYEDRFMELPERDTVVKNNRTNHSYLDDRLFHMEYGDDDYDYDDYDEYDRYEDNYCNGWGDY